MVGIRANDVASMEQLRLFILQEINTYNRMVERDMCPHSVACSVVVAKLTEIATLMTRLMEPIHIGPPNKL
jgi:hypothetical protein